MTNLILRHLLPAVLVLIGLVAAASGAAPVRRGQPGYPVDAPASYQSISARYADQVAGQDWAGFLQSLEKEFFDGRTGEAAEKRARAGFRETTRLFLSSLSESGVTGGALNESLAPALPAASVDTIALAFVDDVRKKDDGLAKAVTGVFRADRIKDVHSVFKKHVKSYDAGADTLRFRQMLQIIEAGMGDPTNDIVRRLWVRGDQDIGEADPQRIAHLVALLDTCGTTLDHDQRDQLRDQLDIAPAVFTEARLQEFFMLSESIYSILQDAMAPFRAATLAAISAARQRWGDFTDTALSHQFFWEMALNQVTGMTGDIEFPPPAQFILLHPLLAVEFADPKPEDAWNPLDELIVESSMQVNAFGYSWLDTGGRYQRRFSVSLCASYRGDITQPGYGLSFGFKRWVDVGVIHRRVDDKSTISLIFSADFWGLISKEQSGFVRKNAEWLDKVEGFIR